MDLVHTIHKRMIDERLMFVYRGKITEKNSLPLIHLIENEMKNDSYGITGRKRLFMFILESLQNIIKHGDRHYADMSVVTYAKKRNGYTITSGNMIESRYLEELENKLVQINKLDTQGIKAQYLHILNNSELSKKGGAGLGLLEMAIKTGNKLDYDFVPFNKDFTYFVLSKTANSTGKGVSSGDKITPFESKSLTQIEQMMAENKIYMIWSGHFYPKVGEEVLSLSEMRLSENDFQTLTRKRIFNIQVEILENVSKYNPGREAEEKYGLPILMIGLDKGKFILSTGNLILNSAVADLKVKLDAVNGSNRTGLKELFSKSLSEQTIETESTGNLGLIDIALKSGSKLEYNFDQVNDDYSYFFLTVGIRIDNDQ